MGFCGFVTFYLMFDFFAVLIWSFTPCLEVDLLASHVML